MVRWQATGDERSRKAADELCAGMRRIAIDRGDLSYYPEKGGWGEPTTFPRSGWRETGEAAGETEGVEGSMTGYHAHPILSPDASVLLFNSNITGTPQAYMVTGMAAVQEEAAR